MKTRLILAAALAAIIIAFAAGAAVAGLFGDDDPAVAEHSWSAYFACLERSDTDDPQKADNACRRFAP